MLRLSSPSTFFYKRVFPALWLGFLILFVVIAFGMGRTRQHADTSPFLIGPGVMAIFGLVLMRKLVFDLIDEVWLDGDHLVIKNRGESTRLSLRDVINVNAVSMTNPRRITLMLRNESSRFGKELTFVPNSPRGFLSGFKIDPVAADLIRRIDALRQRPA